MTDADTRTVADAKPGLTRRSALVRGASGLTAVSGLGSFLAACGSSSSGGSAKSLNAWWWGDPAAMPKWLSASAAKFKAQQGVSVDIQQQQTTSFISNFTAAGQAHQGPQVAAQWATLPVLSQVWRGNVKPLDDYVPASELSHWSFREENFYGGKHYAMPLYVIGQPFVMNKKLFAQAGLDPDDPPKTWDQFLAVCAKLKAKGITPFGLGNSDTFGGRWALSFMGMQNLDSPADLKAPLLGEVSFADPKYSQFMELFKELADKKYFNDDALSLDSTKGANVFGSGKAAMTWTSDQIAVGFAKSLGAENVAVIDFPIFGTGKLAKAYTATQSCSYFLTDWAKNPQTGAKFLEFLHAPAQQKSLYAQCGVVPADDRFDRSVITDPLQKQLTDRASSGLQVWLENWIPPSFDDSANGPGGQALMTGKSVKSVVQNWDQQAKAWRQQDPVAAQKYKNWAAEPVTA